MNPDPVTVSIPQLIQDIHDKDDAFRARILERWPMFADPIGRLKKDPNCQCSLIIASQFPMAADPDGDLTYFYGFPAVLRRPQSIAGEVRNIPDNLVEFMALVQGCKVEGELYRGMSVVPRSDGTLSVFFY
jgi:hypothetical protein